MDYKMTVIMSNYNQAQYIQQAVESVLMQKTDFNYQLIITDDNSTKDNSIAIIKEYEKKYPTIIKTIFSEKNGGYLANILRAKSITKTDYFCLLDADDYWTDDKKLQNAVDFLEANPEYTIYSTNTLCVNEDDTSYPFIKTKCKEKNYSIDDFITGNILITQTTGSVFRNVIFKYGIPKIMSDAVGTFSERSFEGDTDRYIMHLKYGKAKFINHIDGVYRILSNGIWSRLDDFSKAILSAQGNIDYDLYFDEKYKSTFLYKCYQNIVKALDYIPAALFNQENSISFDMLFSILNTLIKNKDLLIAYQNTNRINIRFKDKIGLAAWKFLDRKVKRRGLNLPPPPPSG